MRSVFVSEYKIDKKYLIYAIITLILAIILDIVICKSITNNEFMRFYASEYIYYVYTFSNGKLAVHSVIKEALYFYACFCVARYTRFKIITLPFYFIKCFIDTAYIIIFFTSGISGGFMAALFIFIPSTLTSLCLQFLVTDSAKIWHRKIALIIPIIFSAAECLLMLLLINIIFRLIVSIV